MEKEAKALFDQKFDELCVGGTIELPISLLTPIIPDEMTSSYSSGYIEVYRSSKSNNITIDDGNHRFYKNKREKIAKNNFQQPDWDLEVMIVRKVIPEIEW